MAHIEKKWMEQLKAGDSQAYKAIFRAYYKLVVGAALRITKDPNLAKDTAQEVFLELWKNRERLSIKTSLKSYLHRGAINRSLNNIKSRKRHSGQDLETITERSTDRNNPSEALLQTELEEKIHQAIDLLPTRCRQVFVLSRFERKSYKEIAAIMEISVKTVENQILKALKILRKVVKEYKEN